MSNVYKKLQEVKAELKTLTIKESGENKFAGFRYMELRDFLPHIVDLCHKHGLCTVISFSDIATLTVINSDKPDEQIIFTSPMSTAELKGCHAIQNLGAVETYLRRYLYVAAFDIVEHDALDSIVGVDDKKEPKQGLKPTEEPIDKTVRTTEVQAEILRAILLDWCQGDLSLAITQLKEFSSFVPKKKNEKDPDPDAVWLDWNKLEQSSAKWVAGVTTKVKEKINKGISPEIDEIPF